MDNSTIIGKAPLKIKFMAKSALDALLKNLQFITLLFGMISILVGLGVTFGVVDGNIRVIKNEQQHTNSAVLYTNKLINDHINDVDSKNIPNDVSGKIYTLESNDKEIKVELKYFNQKLNSAQKDVNEIKNILIKDHRSANR